MHRSSRFVLPLAVATALLVGCAKEEPVVPAAEPSTAVLFRTTGTVVDESGTPVEGMGIGCYILGDPADQYVFYYDTTGADGRFISEHEEVAPMDTTIALAFSDLDGAAHGHFADTVVTVHYLRGDLHGGVAEKDITVVLRRL